MAFDISFPKPGDQSFNVFVDVGQSLFVLGANGAGKSRLMLHIYKQHSTNAERISAHRQMFFNSSGVELAPQARISLEGNLRSWNSRVDAAWMEHSPESRANVALFDLIEAENKRARDITTAIDAKRDADARALADRSRPPIQIINELFKLSNLPIVVSAGEHGTLNVQKSNGSPYGINRLSDGERNALLIAGAILTAKGGRLILIDEPERHLHRSIISPLLTHLIQRRSDCAFVVSTHDVSLVTDNASARVLLLRGCTFQSDEVATAWDADLVESTDTIDDAFKTDILGARRCTVFVEGQSRSLDNRLYGLLFERATVIPKESCRDVIHTVTSINSTANLHWVRAFGIIDNDGRTGEEITKLGAQHIHALPSYSVESIYYSPTMQRVVAERKAKSEGGNAADDLVKAMKAAMSALARQSDHLCRRRTEIAIRQEVLAKLPSPADLQTLPTFEVSIDVKAALTKENERLDALINAGDLVSTLARYPVRESGMLNDIARALRFQNSEQYETAVITALIDEKDVLASTRKMFEPLIAEIKAA